MKKILFFFIFLFSCSNQSTIPKPKAFFYNELTEPNYVNYNSNCGYSFFVNSKNDLDSENCNIKIINSSLNSTIYLSPILIENNFNLIDSDFSKKINENSSKAFSVNVSEFNDLKNKVFAKYYSFTGNAPSNTRFYITDSISVYLTGSLYFDSKPNYDSLLPSIFLVNNEIRKMIQTFKWK